MADDNTHDHNAADDDLVNDGLEEDIGTCTPDGDTTKMVNKWRTPTTVTMKKLSNYN